VPAKRTHSRRPKEDLVIVMDHQRLDAYRLSLEFLVDARAHTQRLPPGHADLANQLLRAATSIPLNIAEGAGEFSSRDKARFYRMARRSATECAAILDVFVHLSLLPAESVQPAMERLGRIVAMLVRIARHHEAQASLRTPSTGKGTRAGTGSGSGSG
jgi:four helix bundle protein